MVCSVFVRGSATASGGASDTSRRVTRNGRSAVKRGMRKGVIDPDAAAVQPNYADGAWLVELAPVTDPTQVALAVAAALSIRERGVRSWRPSAASCAVASCCWYWITVSAGRGHAVHWHARSIRMPVPVFVRRPLVASGALCSSPLAVTFRAHAVRAKGIPGVPAAFRAGTGPATARPRPQSTLRTANAVAGMPVNVESKKSDERSQRRGRTASVASVGIGGKGINSCQLLLGADAVSQRHRLRVPAPTSNPERAEPIRPLRHTSGDICEASGVYRVGWRTGPRVTMAGQQHIPGQPTQAVK